MVPCVFVFPRLLPFPQMPKTEKLCGHLSLKEAESSTENHRDFEKSGKTKQTVGYSIP